MLSKEHIDLIYRWGLDVNNQTCRRLLDKTASENDKHKMLQLWRKINANNMLYSLGSRRHAKTVEYQFPSRVDMPVGISEALYECGMIIHPLRLANMNLLNSIVDEIAISPLSGDDVKHNVTQNGYVTISHVWADGKMDTKAPLCRNALVDLEARYIWMDKICIDQDEPDEVALEIPRLKDYYKVAPLCLLAVTASDRSIVEMDGSITQLWKFHEVIESQAKSTSKLSYSMISAYREKMDVLIGQLARNGVLHHQWFTRIWTLPEMSVTQDLVVSNGDEYAYMTPLIKLIGKYGHVKSREMFAEEGIVGCFDTLRMTGGYTQFTLSEAMESSVGRTCSVVEDKIHALMGMVPSISGLPIEYDVGINKTLSASCKLAYDRGDVSWILNTGTTDKGFPVYGTRFLCPLHNDGLWLNHEHVTVGDTGITILGSSHLVESWVHIHEADSICGSGRLSHDIALWSSLLSHTSSDIRELVRLAGWMGTASSTSFGLILVVVFCMSKPTPGLSVVMPSCVKEGIVTTLIVHEGRKVHMGRSVVIGSGTRRRPESVLVF